MNSDRDLFMNVDNININLYSTRSISVQQLTELLKPLEPRLQGVGKKEKNKIFKHQKIK